MSHILNPDLFQAFCLAAVTFELPVIVQLLRGEWRLPDAGSWFDEEVRYTKNTALTYVFVTLLCVLVVARGMGFFLPKLRIIILYNAVLHTVELLLFLHCFTSKQDVSNVSVYVIGGLMTGNVGVFVARLFYLKGQEKAAEVANLKWRQEQLESIRQKRAAYAQEKLEKKEK